MSTQLQIDFLPVESGEKSGDAIAFRYGNFADRRLFKVVIIDGGTRSSGNDLVDFVQEKYGTDLVDLVICTHPDADHASGLREVLEKCRVTELWIHRPWEHSAEICDLFHDGRITDNSLSERLRKAYTYAYQLVQIAERKGIDVREPFAGRQSEDGFLTVLGPTVDYYRQLIPEFTRSPQAKSLAEAARSVFERAITWIKETFDYETLDESGETSAENRSSAVVLLELEGHKYLFTGDAGIESMQNVLSFAKEEFIDLSYVRFFQVPHHGSKRNISPSILDAISCNTAFISASKDAPKHPAKKVTNALIRRGATVYSTEGCSLMHNLNASRAGWSPANSVVFSEQVEE